jgi:CubicO group peptidase (beta-lactamase class C family)
MNRKIKEKMKKELSELLDRAIIQKITPGAAVAVSRCEGETCVDKIIVCRGNTHYERGKRPVTEDTFYDLASLTKPLVTVVSLMTLLQRNQVSLKSSLTDLLTPASVLPDDKKKITLWQLMSHCSGLPAHRPYFADALAIKREKRKGFFLQSILAEDLQYRPATTHLYSDLGYIILGFVIEKVTGMDLDGYFEQMVSKPLCLEKVLKFGPLSACREHLNCAVTETDPWNHNWLCGVVHDDNCRTMGGVAAHAGLFGTAGGVLRLCDLLCETWQGRGRRDLFSPEVLHRVATQRQGSSWTCGFDTPSSCQSSSGRYFGPSSIGHLGFTGTSMWLDLSRGISVVLLTNRVHPSRKNEAIRRLRPELHDIIMENMLQ